MISVPVKGHWIEPNEKEVILVEIGVSSSFCSSDQSLPFKEEPYLGKYSKS